MKHSHAIPLFLLGALALGTPHIITAGAYDDLVGIGGQPGNVPEPSNPEPVDPSSGYDNSDNSNDSSNTGNSGGIFNWFKPKPVDHYQKAAEIRARADRAYGKGNYSDAVKLYKRALRHTPNDADLARKLSTAESTLAANRARRNHERHVRQQEREAAHKKPLQSPVPPLPATTVRPKPSPIITAVPATFVSATQTRSSLRDIKVRIDVLRKNSPTSDLHTLDILLAKYVNTWVQAVSRNDLTDKDRESLQLEIPVRDVDETGGKPASISKNSATEALAANEEPSYGGSRDLETMLARFNADRAQQGAEQLGEKVAETIFPENIAGKFGDILALGKVSGELSRDNTPGAIKEVVDIIIGKLAIPQASFAVDGGRIYSATAFLALNKFMEDSTQAVGGTFNRKEFWESLRNQMNTGQKAVMEWIGGPDGK